MINYLIFLCVVFVLKKQDNIQATLSAEQLSILKSLIWNTFHFQNDLQRMATQDHK